MSIHLALFWQGTASFATKPHASAVCLHISRVMVSAYSRAASVAPLFVKSLLDHGGYVRDGCWRVCDGRLSKGVTDLPRRTAGLPS